MSNEILDRMLSNVENTSKSEGTLIFDALSPVSKELELVNAKIDNALKSVFAATALGNGDSKSLELRTNESGVYRKPGQKATGTLTIVGAADTVIEKGSLFQTKDNLQFQSTSTANIGDTGTIEIPILAIEVGSKYNVIANSILELPVQLIGINSVTNVTPLMGGYDVESDTDLYKRYELKIQTPATSGNKNHYKLWTLEVNGVGDCEVKPLWDGPGTVKIIVIDSNKRTPSQDIITNVINHIEQERPIGATVTVVGVVELTINISVTLVIDSSTTIENAITSIKENTINYLKNNTEKVVRYTKIANCVLDAEGLIDYSNLTVNDGTSNIILTDEQVSVMGEVVASA